MDNLISRRSFLKGSVLMAAGALGSYALAGCSPNSSAKASTSENTTAASNTAAAKGTSNKVALHRGYVAAHGDKCFTQVAVAVDGEGKIVAVDIDDYQFMDAKTPDIHFVPNSDSDFGTGSVEGYSLMSKHDNSDAYSKPMAEKGGSTQEWGVSIDAIEAFAIGKKPEEITSVALDAVSGATLVDTSNYLAGVAQVAKDGSIVSEGSYDPNGAPLKIGRVNAVCHGTKSFGNAVSLVQGDTIVASSIDEFDFAAADSGMEGVPNSDKTFGANYYAEGKILISKSVNNEKYSARMAEKVGATTAWLASIQAIESAVAGQKIAEVSIAGPDAVSGATLVDTANYAAIAVEAAEVA